MQKVVGGVKLAESSTRDSTMKIKVRPQQPSHLEQARGCQDI
jgi:hypothetical protein